MADHDRDAGSRGEEEAPRDPTPGGPQGAAKADSAPTDAYGAPRLRYGQIPPGPRDYPTAGYPSPNWDSPGEPPRPASFRDRLRGRRAQLAGAGLAGVVLGTLLGGTAVAMLNDGHDRVDHGSVYWERRGPQRLPGFCRPDDDGGRLCVVPMPPRMEQPRMEPLPDTGPTSTG
ncbi:hypothetical protein MF672_048670 [Actinomadura sp. ATCC 31491]|uniref:Uncharacterized protein n=1 Tax=Actinomadura luzonensis TaxID=2805427 RepID=A0ABT0GAJ0_9ACTN|nr:hypothetical protein [Actinomadura luzonensis]MCK2221629.1 hypothetical protein [Actinomadura luzonensis]